MKNKTHVISEFFYPSDNSTAYYITEITRALSTVTNINVLCSTPLGARQELDFIRNSITRVGVSSYDKNNLFSRTKHFLLTSIKLGWKVFKQVRKGDKVFAVTNPAFLIIFLGLLKKIKSFHLTILVYDIFPENILAAGILKKKGTFYLFTKWIFDWAYSQADGIVVIGRDMEEVVREKVNSKVPMKLITNWCDTQRVEARPKKDNQIIKDLGLEGKIVFSFAGNFGRVQGIQNLLDAALQVKNELFVLLFMGDGAMRPNIESFIKSNLKGNVVYGGSFPPSEENIFLNACDVSVISLSSAMYGLGVPSKSYHNMAAAKPLLLIGERMSEVGQVIQENQIGWVVDPNNPKALAEKFEEICANYPLAQIGARSRQVVEQHYSKDMVLEEYKKLYQDER